MQQISLQKLFALACILKVVSAGIGWYTNSPWLFGLWIPIGVMVLYMVLGYYKRDTSISEEKFADSCYYLGFIFTIASIIFSLFDLKNIGTGLADIGIRFGAAMVSTCLGVAVRVALVTFRPSTDEALRSVEEAVIDSSRRLTDEFTRAFEQLVDFRGDALTASREATNSVQVQIESMAEQHKQKTETFFNEMTAQNSEMLVSLHQDVKAATKGLSSILTEYEAMAKSTSSNLDKTVRDFISVVDNRLKSINFPDDIFSRSLAAPIAALQDSTNSAAESTSQISREVKESARSVATAVIRINTQAETLGGTLETLKQVSGDQQELVFSMKRQQQSVLDQMTAHHSSFVEAASLQQGQMLSELKAHSAGVKNVSDVWRTVAEEMLEGRKSTESYLSGVVTHTEQLGESLQDSFTRFATYTDGFFEQARTEAGEPAKVAMALVALSSKLDALIGVAEQQLEASNSSMRRLESIEESIHTIKKPTPAIGYTNGPTDDNLDSFDQLNAQPAKSLF